MMQLEPNVPHMFFGASMLTFANAMAGDSWVGALLQGGALVMLAGILWVIFKELAPGFLRQMRELQELRHSEHANFISALSEIRAAHSAELARIQEAHRNDLAMVVETQRKGMEQIADALRMLNEPRR